MKVEYSPLGQDEENKAAAAKAEADDDDDDEEKEKKSAPRRAPGITFEKVKPESNKKEEKPRISISDRLLERLGAKPEEKAESKDDNVPEVPPAAELKTAVAEAPKPETAKPTVESSESVELAEDDVVDVPFTIPVGKSKEAAKKDFAEKLVDTTAAEIPLETAEWESEAVSSVGGKTPEHYSSGEVVPEPPEKHEEFAEIPPAPEAEGEEPEVETGPIEPELLEAGLGSEGPPEPPEDVPATAGEEDAPEPIRRAAATYSGGGGYAGRPWYDAAAADRTRKVELDEAEYQGRTSGIRKGLGAGLLFGWMFGRHGKKKQAKAFAQELKGKDKEINALKTEQTVAGERIEAVKRTQEQLRSNIQEQQAKLSAAPENVPGSPQEAVKPTPMTDKTTESSLQAAASYESTPVAAALAAERGKNQTEKTKIIEKAPEEQEITEKTYHVAEGRRVETSVWHRIEIDEKTGKPVNNPEVAYGQEFKHEKAQEVLHQDAAFTDNSVKPESKEQRPQPAGGGNAGASSPAAQIGGLAAASYAQGDQTYATAEEQESGLGALPIGPPPEHHLKGGGILRYASMPAIWLAAILFVAVLFVLGVLR